MLFVATNLLAQQKRLTLYTKKECSNCKHAKDYLAKVGIAYNELKVENINNGREMGRLLKRCGYTGNMYMPMLLFKGKIVYPIKQVDTTYSLWSLDEALQHINSNWESTRQSIAKMHEKLQSSIDDNCEVKELESLYYLVCTNFESKNNAQEFVVRLKSRGYKNAGVLDYGKYFRAYLNTYLTKDLAQEDLMKSKSIYRTAYLLYPYSE